MEIREEETVWVDFLSSFTHRRRDLMGRKNIKEKLFEDYNDVFIDIFAVLLFGCEQVIKPYNLENYKDRLRFKASDDKYMEQERDDSK